MFVLLLTAPAFADRYNEIWETGAMGCASRYHGAHDLTHNHKSQSKFASDKAKRHEPPDRTVDFLALYAELTVEPKAGTINGFIRHKFKSISVPRTQILLHAARELKITEIKDKQGRVLKFSHKKDRLVIRLANALPLNVEQEITIQYHGSPNGGLHFVQANRKSGKTPEIWSQGETSFSRQWLPLWDYPNDRYFSELKFNVPEEYLAIGNGDLVSEVTRNGRRIAHYKMSRDHVGYLLSLSVGQFEVSVDAEKFPILWYAIYPEDKPHLERSLGETRKIIDAMAEFTAMPYPYLKYSQTVASAYPLGGMENITATTLGRTRAMVTESAAMGYHPIGLVIHEAAHQWFGDLITCRDWAHMWLNEGFATYFTAMVLEKIHSKARAMESLERMKNWYLGETERYTRPIVTYVFDEPGSIFDAHTYAKGAWVLHMLRAKLGDADFLKGIRAYVKQFKDGLAETEDLMRVMEHTSGKNLHHFFHQWLYRAGHPRLQATISNTNNRILLTVKQRTDKPFKVPLTVRALLSDGTHQDWTVELNAHQNRFNITPRIKAVGLELDPNGVLLKTLKVTAPDAWLQKQLLAGSTVRSRADAAKFLDSESASPKTISTLKKALNKKTEDRLVQGAAAASLAGIRTESACRALVTGTKAKEARVRRRVMTGLTECQGDIGISALKRGTKDVSIHVVGAALTTLGHRLADNAKPYLLKGLQIRSWNETVASGAVAGFNTIEAPWALNTVLDLLKQKSTPARVRLAVVSGFAGLASRNDTTKQRLITTLRTLVEDDDLFVVRASLRTLAKIGSPDDLGYLEKGIKKLPRKWYHKEAHKWRRALKHNKNKSSNNDTQTKIKGLKKKIKRLKATVKSLEKQQSQPTR